MGPEVGVYMQEGVQPGEEKGTQLVPFWGIRPSGLRSEEHTSELQSQR